MRSRTPAQQIELLRKTTSFASRFHKWLLAAAVIGVLAAIVLWHPVLLMIAVFVGVVGLAERRAGPNIVAAIAAYDSGVATAGEVVVEITAWDSDDTYHAIVREPGLPDWKFDFIPQGWRPASGNNAARIWRSGADGRPVLTIVEEGILIPRGKARRVGEMGE